MLVQHSLCLLRVQIQRDSECEYVSSGTKRELVILPSYTFLPYVLDLLRSRSWLLEFEHFGR